MILPIIKVGGGPNISELTASSGDVLSEEKFIGAGGEEMQMGNIVRRGSPEYTLGINGTQKLPAGYYTGGHVKQNIETMGAASYGPGARMITIPTAGKYMTGDITIRAVKNLSTSVIKKGQYVGGVGPGTWEGYVNKDPKVPYYYGAFNGIQSITVFKYKRYDNVGDVSLERDYINVYVKNNTYYTAIVFNEPIDLTNLSRLIVRLEYSKSSIDGISLYRNKVTDYMYDNAQSTKLVLNPNIGDKVAGMSTSGSGGDFTLNLAAATGKAYLYLLFSNANTAKIRMVKFE